MHAAISARAKAVDYVREQLARTLSASEVIEVLELCVQYRLALSNEYIETFYHILIRENELEQARALRSSHVFLQEKYPNLGGV